MNETLTVLYIMNTTFTSFGGFVLLFFVVVLWGGFFFPPPPKYRISLQAHFFAINYNNMQFLYWGQLSH